MAERMEIMVTLCGVVGHLSVGLLTTHRQLGRNTLQGANEREKGGVAIKVKKSQTLGR